MSRIGLVIYDLRSGGAERVLCKWSDMLSEGNDVYIYTFDSNSKPEYTFTATLRELEEPSKGRGKINQIATVYQRYNKLNKAIKKDKIDLVISFCSTANFPTMFIRGKKAASIRLFSEYSSYKKIYDFLIKYTSTKLIVQTERLKKEIVDAVGKKYSSRILVIGNPLDLERISEFCIEEPEQEFLRQIEGYKIISFVSSFKSTKNHWNLLKSFKLIHDHMPDTKLVLVGGQGELEKNTKKMVENSDIKDAVIFTGKTLNPFKYTKYSDVFVLPSITEGIPNVLIEAMATGLPVVSTDCLSGPREILCKAPDHDEEIKGIKYADYGILVETFNPNPDFSISNICEQNVVLAEAIENVLSDTALCQKLKKASIDRSKDFDIPIYKEKLRIIVRECINE